MTFGYFFENLCEVNENYRTKLEVFGWFLYACLLKIVTAFRENSDEMLGRGTIWLPRGIKFHRSLISRIWDFSSFARFQTGLLLGKDFMYSLCNRWISLKFSNVNNKSEVSRILFWTDLNQRLNPTKIPCYTISCLFVHTLVWRFVHMLKINPRYNLFNMDIKTGELYNRGRGVTNPFSFKKI